MNNICNNIPNITDKYWDDANKFYNEYTQKKEINDSKFFSNDLNKVYKYLISDLFIKKLENLTNTKKLIIDSNMIGGGLTISPPNSHLQKHTDFNFNSKLKLYRCVNVILYLNYDWNENDGGFLELYDISGNNNKKILPTNNTLFIFKSNNNTPHGFTKIISNKCRKSLNLWYYTDCSPENVDTTPHKTKWI